MRPLLFLPLALAAPSLAQDTPNLTAALPAPAETNLSGTVEATLDGVSTRAKIRFDAPNGLRLNVEANPEIGLAARQAEASGAQTLFVEANRARRTNFNGVDQWFRTSNEPLMQAIGPWLSPIRELEKMYTLATSRDGEATIIEARANDVGKYLRREQVRSGGAGGQRFYAARSVAAWNRPARIRLRVEANHIVRREDFAAFDSTRPLQTWTWRYENNRPALIEARDSRDAVRARWNLNFDAAPADLPAISAPAEAIIEGDAPAGDQASALLAQGIASARNENYGAAVAAINQAAALKPRAIAAPLALFEIALTTRNEALARAVLLKISALDGDISARSALARARLALQRNASDATKEVSALPQVLEGNDNAAARLQAADLTRGAGQRDGAAQLLLPLLGDKIPATVAAQAIARLDEWFTPLEQQERNDFAAKITGTSTWAQAARAILQNQEAKVDASQAPAVEFLLARQAALAGRDDEAARLWQSVAQHADEALWLRSQLSLAQLAARRNNTSEALAAHRAAWPFLDGESARENWLRSVSLPWIKINRTKVLRAALRDSSLKAVSRATSEAAQKALDESEADARLLLTLSEAEDDALDTLRAQAARWKNVSVRAAWWQGRLGEVLTGVASDTPLEAGSARKKDSLFDEAIRAVDAAIALEPAQPFYREQKLLIASRRVSGQSSVSDAASGVRDRENAQATLSALRASFPKDPDALLSAGLSLLTLKQERAAAPLLQQSLAQLDALAGDAQDAGSERVARVTARSSLAGALRKVGGADGAAQLYSLLFAAARSPIEQGAFAANWLNALYDAREAAGAAAILSQVARTSWKPSQTQEVLAQVLASISVRPPWRAAVRQSLEGVLQAPANAPGLGEGAALVAAYLDFSVLNSARRAVVPAEKEGDAAGTAPATPAASPQAQQNLDAAVAVWKFDLARLEKLAASTEASVAGQALSLLAQDALLRGQAEQAAAFFERALQRVPGDENLAFSLANALSSKAPLANGTRVAQGEDAARIIKARDSLLKYAPSSVALLEQAAAMSQQAGNAPDAQALRARAQQLAFFDDSSSPDDYDRLAAPATP